MNRISAPILLLLLLSSCAHWSTADTYRQAAIIGLEIADWRQTRYIANHPQDYYEMNPLIGEHPSVGRVNTYFAASIASRALVSALLPPPYRAWWQYISIGAQGFVVIHNFDKGIGW